MFKIYTLDKVSEWKEIIKGFTNYDVHYLPGYVAAFSKHGDGDPRLFYFSSDSMQAATVVMQRDVSESEQFKGLIPARKYYDLTTAYGYGGFLFEGEVTEQNLKQLDSEYTEYCLQKRIVSEFVKFHPLHNRSTLVEDILYETITVGHPVTMHLDSPQQIWDDLSSSRRRVIRKGMREGVEIRWSNNPQLLETFIPMYNATLKRDQATDYFYFDDVFYQTLLEELKYELLFLYAVYDGKIISIAMILFSNQRMQYFLSGSDPEFNHLSPTSQLIYEAARYGQAHGYKQFHLGGGLPSLLKYKQGFNKHSDLSFQIGRKVFDQARYDELLALRKEDPSFDSNSNFFPKYRA